MANARGQKRDLEKARMERAAMKRARRQTRGEGGAESLDDADTTSSYAEADVLAELAALHRRHADEQISQDDFEATRDELMQRLRIN